MAFVRDTGIASLNPAGDVLAKSDRTATGSSAWIDTADYTDLVAQLHSNAGTGTAPTLDVRFQTSYDGTDANAVDVPSGAFAQVTTSASNQIKGLATAHRYLKVIYTITGTTPSFNFGVYLTARR